MATIDEAFEASEGWDLERMLRAEPRPTTAVNHHFLLLRICEITYKQRRDLRMHDLFLRYAKTHVSEFGRLAVALRKEFSGFRFLPHVPTFERLATVLTEEGDFEGAEQVCRVALSFDLHDNTKGGFEARIDRIRRNRTMQP